MKNSSFNNIYNSAPRVTTNRKRQPTRKLCPNNFSCLGEEQFSLVLASFTFEEIWNLREQSLFMFIDWGMVSEGFFLFFFFWGGRELHVFLRGQVRDQLLLTESEGRTMEIIPFTPSLPSPLPSSLHTVFFDRLVIYITLVKYRKHVFKAKISLKKASGRSVMKWNCCSASFKFRCCVYWANYLHIFSIVVIAYNYLRREIIKSQWRWRGGIIRMLQC